MEYSKIERNSLITIIVITIILFVFKTSYGLGFLLGGLASLLAFKWLERLENVSLDNFKVLKRSLTTNRLVRYSIYALVLAMCFLSKDKLNYFCCFFALFTCRCWITLIGGIKE